MGILLDTIATRLGYSKASPAPMPPILQATGSGQAYTLPDMSLPDAQEELFQRLSWVYGAVMAVSTVAAGAQLNVLKLQGEKRKDIPNHDFELRLMRPNPLDSRSEFMIKTFAFLNLTGNCYWWLNRRNENQPPAEMWVLPPHQVQPIPDGRMFLKGYTYEPGQGEQARTLEPWEVVHFKRFHPRNWFVGLSPIEALATVSLGDLKAQEYNTNFFGRDNAKPGGALAFSDPVNQDAWDKLKSDLKAQWGGTQRSGPLLLRGVGAGGVQWVSMSLSQKDMEFLASRTFTKEEIYSIFAPGLASVLDVNATEANAKSGKATFIDMAVWPMLVGMAEKITNNLLPVYGPDLVAEFDDLRIVDRVLELQEQSAFSAVHTVNEIREKYYDDKPLKDDRGELLPVQIGPTTPGPEEEEPEEESGLSPMPPLEGEQPPPQQPQEMPPMQPLPETAEGEAEDAQAMQAEALSVKELGSWRRYAVRHGAAKAQEFAPDHVQADVAAVIKARLAAATSDAEVRAAFSGPFLKTAANAEAELLRQLQAILGESLETIVKRLGNPPDMSKLAAYWPEHERELRQVIQARLEEQALDAIEETMAMGAAVDWAEAAQDAAEWASTYAGPLVAGIVATSRTVVGDKVGAVIAGTLALAGLLDALKPFFGESRAGVIAATEITRATTTGQRLAVNLAKQAGQTLVPRWHTKNDELVCIGEGGCAERNEQLIKDDVFPPLHPWCRCFVTYHWVRGRGGS